MKFLNSNRRTFMKGTAATGIAALALGKSGMVYANTGGTLKARIMSDIGAIDPPFWTSGQDFDTMNLIHGKLIDFVEGTEWKWELLAAESMEVLSDTETKFTLKKDLLGLMDLVQ
jgi:peptide/nickel transport system substrate-binding protein